MPEGPEIALARDELKKELLGVEISGFYPGDKGRYAKSKIPGQVAYDADFGRHAQREPVIVDVDCKGKFMWWRLELKTLNGTCKDKPWFVHITHGMSGKWTFKQFAALLDPEHVSIAVRYRSPRTNPPHCLMTAYFIDPRRFGTIKFVQGNDAHQRKLNSLGPDMLNGPPTIEEFAQRILKKRNKTICEVLMNQSVISGVGNYIKCEALYMTSISPFRVVSDLTVEEITSLYKNIKGVMNLSYTMQGATFRTHENPNGYRGNMSQFFLVYGRKQDNDGNTIVKSGTPDGRTTYWVPERQT